MKAGTQHNSPVFEKIKRSLDPAYSYLIFEKAFSSLDSAVFQGLIDGITHLNSEIFDSKIYHDKNLGLSLLVVRIDPGRTDDVMQDVLNIGIPNDVIFYSYGSRI
jgi:hypothetical protein